MGALFQWRSIDDFNKLHKVPRFLEIKHIRDEALQSFSNGHFFTVDKDTSVIFDEGESYALIAQMEADGSSVSSPLVEFKPAPGVGNKDYSPVNVQIAQWDESCDKILQEGSSDIFKFILNMPK
jgi:aspartyl aminopeptidase